MTPLVDVHNLTHRFGTRAAVLRSLSFQVQAGERVAVIGPNGAGKTTLFLRLAGVLAGEPDQIRVAGLDPARPADRRQLPARLGVVFQNPDDQLLAITVYDDVAMGPRNLGWSESDCNTAVEAALAQVGWTGSVDRVPLELSGGEKRRVALAGVLAMRPELILLDEPSMFLDPRGRRELLQQLRTFSQTLLVATHDLDFALDLCPRTLLLAEGELIVDGPTAALLADAHRMEQHGLEVPWRLRPSD
jgi:energy-coupling factor transporter ATP-binding protein EcfA2